ncbi:MAG TPA: leucyl aminopeptidase [Vicinamibacterales bacterium]
MPEPGFALHVAPLPAPGAAGDVLVVPVFEGDTFEDVDEVLDGAVVDVLRRACEAGECQGRSGEAFWTAVPSPDGTRRVLGIGAGARAQWDAGAARRVAASAANTVRARRLPTLAVVVRSSPASHAAAALSRLVQASAEGLVLGQFAGGHLKTSSRNDMALAGATLLTPPSAADAHAVLAASAARGCVLGEHTNLARRLGNEPANRLTPTELARRVEEAVRGTAVAVDVLDETRIAELHMGLLLGVARGSSEPPRVIVLRYDPPGAPEVPVLGLVGKGVTFDSGGISIKPADGMDRMKVDMAGGAAVVAAIRAAAVLEAPTRLIGVIPSTENMPSGSATRPGDVLVSAEGRTVEILNTDAEGRLILADALWYARQLGATHLVDVATLTGACVVALGRVMSGLFGTDADFTDVIRQLGELSGDRCWPMPVMDDYFEQLKSEVADMTNTGGRPGGAVTAAVFLKQFTGGLPWAHLDIAGTAWSDENRPHQIKGATGAATRLLAELALDPGRWT